MVRKGRVVSIKALYVAVLLVLTCQGCALIHSDNFISKSYHTLDVAAVAYDNAMKAVAEMYKNGRLSIEDKEQIILAAKSYQSAFDKASYALEMLAVGKVTQDEASAEMNVFGTVYREFVTITQIIMYGYSN